MHAHTNGLFRSRTNDRDLGSNERDFSRTEYPRFIAFVAEKSANLLHTTAVVI